MPTHAIGYNIEILLGEQKKAILIVSTLHPNVGTASIA